MKKMLSLILSLALILSLSVPAMAAEGVGKGDQSAEVKARYVNAIDTPEVYSVDITWGSMEFTYTISGQQTWNPEDHTYSGEVTGGWTQNDPTNGEGVAANVINVVNHSNVPVTIGYAFAPLEGYSTVTGKFWNGSEYAESTTLDKGVEEAPDDVYKDIYLEIGGSLPETVSADYTKVGTITLTLS